MQATDSHLKKDGIYTATITKALFHDMIYTITLHLTKECRKQAHVSHTQKVDKQIHENLLQH